MSVLELKKEYNTVLAREKKAEGWINGASDTEFEKWLPEYNKVINNLDDLIRKIESESNAKLTSEDILYGFSL